MIEMVRETYRYRELIWALALKELKIRYKRSVLGFLWALLNPALLMLVLTLVFSTLMRFPIPHYAIFLLSTSGANPQMLLHFRRRRFRPADYRFHQFFANLLALHNCTSFLLTKIASMFRGASHTPGTTVIWSPTHSTSTPPRSACNPCSDTYA